MYIKKSFSCLLFFIILAFPACQNYSEYSVHESGSAFVSIDDSYIKSASPIDWKVGISHKETVSKGFALKIKLPLLESDSVRELVATRQIDSWILRVNKISYSGSTAIGYVKIPIIIPGKSSELAFKIKQLDYCQISIYYSAAAISQRFENLACPATEHGKEIGLIALEDKTVEMRKISISPAETEKNPGQVEEYGYKPMVLNGGFELTGRYVIDIAFYDSKNRSRASSYFELPSVVEISGERTKIVKGCFNFKIPKIKLNDPNLMQHMKLRH